MSYKEANDVLNYWFGAGDPSKRPKWFGGGEETTEEIRNKFGALVEKARNDELAHWENDPKATLALILLQDQFMRSLYKGRPEFTCKDPYCVKLARKFMQRESHDHLKFSAAGRAFLYLPFEHSEDRECQRRVARNGGLCRQNSGRTEEGGRRARLIVRPLSPPGLLKIRLTSLVSPFLSLLQSLTFLCASTLSDRLEKATVSYVQKCFLFFFNFSIIELSVKLYAQLEEDTKGTDHETYGKQWYTFACLHKEVVDQFGRFPQRNKVLGRENTPEEEDWLNNMPDRFKW
ncbi:unnamed protein product [Porites lobata]|uniref:DUF924 domain-containing protein n=1 Tax=Porites lobata TaxID=104759 RepID=A0ABN8NPM4_9CNID|nr:unnamed protein product [Porites lobata]